MMQTMKKQVKDPKIMTIVALLSALGYSNADTATNVVQNIAQATQSVETGKPPEIKLEGDEDKSEGDLIEFSAVESYGDHFTWDVNPKPADGKVMFKPSLDGRTCQIASYPGVYTVTLFVSNCEGQAVEHRTLTVESNHDCPTPEEPDKPIEPTPPGLAGLAKDAYELALSNVDSSHRGDASKVASVYSSLANNANFTSPQALINQTLVELRNELGTNIEHWKPWHSKLNTAIQKQIASGKLVSISQYKAAWKQIAEGLNVL